MPIMPTAGEPVVTTVMPVAKLPSALRKSRMSMLNAVRSDQIRTLSLSRSSHRAAPFATKMKCFAGLIRRSAQFPRTGGPKITSRALADRATDHRRRTPFALVISRVGAPAHAARTAVAGAADAVSPYSDPGG
jgi:hypothetical protein